jgi:hypothetical protein
VTVNRERVQLLVDALRSGGFAQGTGRLLNAGKYCCLGVACVVAQESGLRLRLQTDENDGDVNFGNPLDWDYDHDYAQLPGSVKDWYGFDSIDPDLTDVLTEDDDLPYDTTEEPAIMPASTWNDDYDRDFTWIADAFERTYLRDGEEK